MAELAQTLGGTPLGVLLILMFGVVVVGVWMVAVYTTRFGYHEQADHREFAAINGRLDTIESHNRERTENIFTALNGIKSEIGEVKVNVAGLEK